jgi:transposase
MSYIKRFRKGNAVYLAEVESKRIKDRVITRYIRYIGKEVDGKTILSTSISDIQVEKVKLFGPLLVLNHLAKEIDLVKHLGNYGNEILSLVFAHCLNYESINQMPDWFNKTDLTMLLDLEGLTEKRLVQALDSLEKLDSDTLQSKIFESVKKRYHLTETGVVYDVTNTYLYGKKCSMGKEGKDKEGVKGRPLIQIGLVVTKDEGIPVFHKTFDGNIHDSRTFQDVISSFSQFGLKAGALCIYDRGITSGRNILDIQVLDWDTLCGVAINPELQRIWREIRADGNMAQFDNRVRLNDTIFYVVSKPYTIGDVKGTIAFCFNERQQRTIKESRYDEITDAQKLLKNNKTIKAGLEKYFDKKGEVIKSVLEKAEEFDGCSTIFCTRKIPKDELIRLYFDKDLVEKAFQCIKGITNLQPIRHWLSNRVRAHVFICYLSYLLLSLLKYRLNKVTISPQEALRELETMYKVYLKDSNGFFKTSRVVTLTKKQELILKTIDKSLLKM